MVDLPVELWHTIFDHLELTSLSSCALVSRTLYSVRFIEVDNLKQLEPAYLHLG